MAKRRNLQSREITDIVNALRHKAEGDRAASVLTVEEGQTLPIGLQHLSQTLVDQADRQERLADELENADILTLTIEG